MILLTNDDGIDAEGLKKLAVEIRKIAPTVIVAPSVGCSGCSHSISLARAEEPREISPDNGCRRFSLEGTPGDCVAAAFRIFGRENISLVVSGINPGANAGLDIHYSGTVAAAFESALFGVPAIAVSLDCPRDTRAAAHYETAAKFAAEFSKLLLEAPRRLPFVLNINVPDVPYTQVRGLLFTVQSLRATEESYEEDAFNGIFPDERRKYPTDREALLARMVSVTPLSLDFTSYSMLKMVEGWTERVWAKREF
ncbi:MAG: 5'/3'-nucleotidase SurE [Planctomycetota bacterium]|nr:5'/3'-nucleotidase SurE [Planctomycetota bacterium]